MKKFLSLLLVVCMALSMTAAYAEETATEAATEVEAVEKGTIIYGSSTEVGGDFWFTDAWTSNATDAMLRDLSSGYDTVVTDQGGDVVINPTVTKSLDTVENEDGTKTYTITINEGLVYNNGEAITAKDFVWWSVFCCSKAAEDLSIGTTAPTDFVGGAAYKDGSASAVSGIRLIDDYTFSVTITAENLPYYYDLLFAAYSAQNIGYWLGEGYDVADDGEGCYIVGDVTADALKSHIETVRFYAGEDRVSSGPYNLVAFDKSALQATLTINPNFVGNFEGVTPSIETIIVVKAEVATWSDAMKTGAFNFYDSILDGDQINTALDIIEDEELAAELGYGFGYTQFDRAGYGKIQFACDVGPTQFVAVRQAIAHLLDRNEFANTFCLGWGSVVNGPYGYGLWQYQESEEWLEENLDPYAYDPAKAVELLVADGWTLNAEGGEYTEGIRYKEVTAEEAGTYKHNVTLADGRILMPLIIEWASSADNPVSDLLKVMLVEAEATKAAGAQINQNVMTFTELINYLYRDNSQGSQYGVPTYGMFNLATVFNPPYRQTYTYTLDPALIAAGANTNFIYDEELDRLSMEMVFGVEAGDTETYMEMFRQFILHWNGLLPDLPLYSNILITVYPDWLEGYEQTCFWSFQDAILYATVAE